MGCSAVGGSAILYRRIHLYEIGEECIEFQLPSAKILTEAVVKI